MLILFASIYVIAMLIYLTNVIYMQLDAIFYILAPLVPFIYLIRLIVGPDNMDRWLQAKVDEAERKDREDEENERAMEEKLDEVKKIIDYLNDKYNKP